MKELIQIQAKLKAPKKNRNTFGNYNYRSCEDILEAVKPICHQLNCWLMLSDEVIAIGDRIYVKATATLYNAEGQSISTSAFAREEESKKGMDGSQITGTASSYARKYALNGLFAIDDTKDADTNEYQGKVEDVKSKKTITSLDLDDEVKCDKILTWIKKGRDKNPDGFDVIGYVRKSYSIDDRTATRLVTLFNIHAK